MKARIDPFFIEMSSSWIWNIRKAWLVPLYTMGIFTFKYKERNIAYDSHEKKRYFASGGSFNLLSVQNTAVLLTFLKTRSNVGPSSHY
ncbi:MULTISPECIES: hypothetical protein [unclassified Paenibacillus]|uniref:hypothetical protein n=1 Tax=unclassified Paenibacillus TaxID=185978 RepID=UPI00240754F4|nr:MULTISPECIES: hypothetical protein [unclassified Paenibacillus]MDF9843728.1 hypothetical protein [Paenibacillus sp. PastF-2]MDF9851774.1 hypothetical protein [Paenibacillus sp. PastM-2]